MKRIICLLLAMMIVLAGCGAAPTPESTSSDNAVTSSDTSAEASMEEGEDSAEQEALTTEGLSKELSDAVGAQTQTETVKQKIRVALIDSGISKEALPEANIAAGYNYITDSVFTDDTFVHGTGMASVIVQYAPNAELVPLVSTYYERSTGNLQQVDSDKLAEIVVEAAEKYFCDVIVVSVCAKNDNNSLKKAIAKVEKAGAVVIAPVGNSNEEAPKDMFYPAAYDTVIGVGALEVAGAEAAYYSQRNRSVFVIAPAAFTVKLPSGNEKEDFGTDLAAAYTAAAAVRVLEKKNDMSPAEVRELFKSTARDIDEKGYDINTGNGALDLSAALEQVQ